MKLKKWLSVTAIGLLTAGVLAACGAGEERLMAEQAATTKIKKY